jgi:cephalosporin hydroxylase
MKLKEFQKKYDTDKGVRHSYIDVYDELFTQFSEQKINLCEIGCLTCQSLMMFSDYFPNATIYGVDNWSRIKDGKITGFTKTHDVQELFNNIQTNYPRIVLKKFDSTEEQVNNHIDANFKVIIDDGDHRPEAQIATFQNFFNCLEVGGFYIIEDVESKQAAEKIIETVDKKHKIKYLSLGKIPDDNLIVIQKES